MEKLHIEVRQGRELHSREPVADSTNSLRITATVSERSYSELLIVLPRHSLFCGGGGENNIPRKV